MNRTRLLIGTCTLAIALLAAACSDSSSGPTAGRDLPLAPPPEDGANTMQKPVLSGTVVVTVRDAASGPLRKALLKSENGSYETPFGESANSDGILFVGGSALPSRLFVPSTDVQRQGKWERAAGRGRR